MRLVPEVHAELLKAGMQPGCTFDKKLGVHNLVFLLQFTEKHLRRDGGPLDVEADVSEFARFRLDRGEESKSLAVDLDHRLIEGDLLWMPTPVRLVISFLDPVMDGRSAPIDAKII